MKKASPDASMSSPCSVIESEELRLEDALERAGWPKTLLAPEKAPELR